MANQRGRDRECLKKKEKHRVVKNIDMILILLLHVTFKGCRLLLWKWIKEEPEKG